MFACFVCVVVEWVCFVLVCRVRCVYDVCFVCVCCVFAYCVCRLCLRCCVVLLWFVLAVRVFGVFACVLVRLVVCLDLFCLCCVSVVVVCSFNVFGVCCVALWC